MDRLKPVPRAVLGALNVRDPRGDLLGELEEREWQGLLSFCDRAQITLALARAPGLKCPDWVRRRLDRNLADNAERSAKVHAAFVEIADALGRAGIEFVTLKGMAQWPDYIADLRHRVQYDIDLFCPEQAERAGQAILDLGYEAGGYEKFPADHLPALVRWNGWKYDGNHFDPQMPIAVDVHFRLWDAQTERFDAPGVEQFWARRTEREILGRSVPVFHSADGLAYCALHALRHWLRGSLKLYHVLEIACFLDARADDAAFWETWRELHGDRLRALEAICFQLAAKLFEGRLAPRVAREIERLPEGIGRWFDHYALSPVRGYFEPNKDELWLHLCLLNSVADKARVIRRRVAPLHLPAPAEVVSPAERWPARARAKARYCLHVAARLSHHARAVLPLARTALAARTGAGSLPRPFWTFFGASALFGMGLFIFFLLYNVHLLNLGFKEDFLGWVTGAMMAGCVAGALPAGALSRRVGLRNTLLLCFTAAAAITVMRALATGPPLLLVSAFLAGLAHSTWAVSIPPVVAQLTSERSRPLGFSVVIGGGIGIGMVGSLVGGWLPRWLSSVSSHSMELALIAAGGFMALAVWPAAHLRFDRERPRNRPLFPRSRFVGSYLAALAIWTVATAAFNPFVNAYFAHHFSLSVASIGGILSIAQAMQVLAILAAPVVLRRLGLVSGIASMQVAAAAGLAALAGSSSPATAAAAYAVYACCQWMSEPGMFTLLMKNVDEEERSGASSLNFFVVFSSQAIAAAVGGSAIARFGYPPVLAAAAAITVAAALMFKLLLTRFDERPARQSQALPVGIGPA